MDARVLNSQTQEGALDGNREQPTAATLRPILARLFNARVHELDEASRDVLTQLHQVHAAVEASGRGVDSLEAMERAVRSVIGEHVYTANAFSAAEQRFLTVCLDAGGVRATFASSSAWQREMCAAYTVLQGREITSIQAVRAALSRPTGTAARLLDRLADAMVAGESSHGNQRQWAYGAAAPLPPGEEAGRFVVITSHAGTGQRAAIEKFRARCLPEALVIDFDTRLAQAGVAYLQRLGRDGWQLPVPDRELPAIFELSRRAIYTIWREALEAVWPEVIDGLQARRTVLFCCAATIHQGATGSTSTVLHEAAFIDALRTTHREPPHVRAALRGALVVTLVDDIYDCFLRLQRLGYPFDPSNAWFTYFSTRSAALSAIVDWRQREIDSAEGLAKLLAWRHVILPMKHPLETLAKIIDHVPIVYFSHPSSAVRAKRPGEISLEQQRVIAIADELAQRPDVALIEPFAIDELRFSESRPSSHKPLLVEAELYPRWRSPSELLERGPDLLWTAPETAGLQAIDQPFQPPEDAGPEGDVDTARLWSAETDQSLLMLRNSVERATRFRQRLLVNQASGGLIVHRPFAGIDGQVRKTAVDEITLRNELREHEAAPQREVWHADAERPSRPIIVYHPPADEAHRAVENLAAALSHYQLDGVRIDADPEQIRAAIAPWVRRCVAGRSEPGGPTVLGVSDIVDFARAVSSLPRSRIVIEPDPLTLDRLDLDARALAEYRGFGAKLAAVLDGLAGDTYNYGLVLFEDAQLVDASQDCPAPELADRYHRVWQDTFAHPEAVSRW